MLRGRQHRGHDEGDHLVHHGQHPGVIALQRGEHHAGGQRVDRAETLRVAATTQANGENGGAPGRVAAVHHEQQRREGERSVAGRAAVAAGGEIGEESAVGLEELEHEGVALAQHQQEIVEIEQQGEHALEGVPVEGGVGERRERGNRVAEDGRLGGHFVERRVAVENGLEAAGEVGEELALRGGNEKRVLEVEEVIGEKQSVSDGLAVRLERGEKQQQRLHVLAERLREGRKQRLGIVLRLSEEGEREGTEMMVWLRISLISLYSFSMRDVTMNCSQS